MVKCSCIHKSEMEKKKLHNYKKYLKKMRKTRKLCLIKLG